MLPDARLSHATSGRLRIKVPSKKGDGAYFHSLKERLTQCGGVEGLSVNPVTGSVLVLHAAGVDAIREYAEAQGLFRLSGNSPLPVSGAATPLSQRVALNYESFDRRLRSMTGGEIDIPGMAFVVLLGLGIYQIGRGNFAAPAWYTAWWYALNIFLKGLPGGGGREGNKETSGKETTQ